MSVTTGRYAGHEALRIEAGDVHLMVTTSVGPRVLALIGHDGANAFAELPDLQLPCPDSPPIHLRGGHRLWAAPEDPRVTYRPDDDPVAVELLEDGARLNTQVDAVAGTHREIGIRVLGPGRFAVEHGIVNHAAVPQRLAAWAITMLAPHGRAWLPTLAGPFDPGGFQAQRNVVLWPYSSADDPRFVIGDQAIEVRSDRIPGHGLDVPFKVGTSLRRGWVAHWRSGVLFVKRAGHDEALAYADMGASAQVYSHPRFTELETLGPLATLAPGESVVHREDWEVHLVGEAEAERLVGSGALDRTGEGQA
jgi:hypothetical protein